MEEMFIKNLDYEYKQYLEIMRPQLGQLKDHRTVSVCNAWIQRLSTCKEHEKLMRNRYILKLCYQLTKGLIETPFLKEPTDEDLLPVSEPTFSEITNSEVECIVIDSNDIDTKVVFNKKISLSDTEVMSQYVADFESRDGRTHNSSRTSMQESADPPHPQSFLCYNCPEMYTKYEQFEKLNEGYEYRATNIISKLREIKKQNTILHNELHELKEKSVDENCTQNNIIKVNNATSAYVRVNESNSTLNSLKSKLKEVQDVRNALIDKIQDMQEKLDNFNDLKSQQIEEIEAKHKIEMFKFKSTIREEIRNTHDNKVDELKQHYDNKIKELENYHLKALQDLTVAKDAIIAEKDYIIQQKDAEIARLNKVSDEKLNLHSALEKMYDRSQEEHTDGLRMKNQLLEKRLHKMEKSKHKCIKAFETKLATIQRENHLTECSLQLQLVRQRAQVVSEVTDDSQTQLKSALDKLEAKYKDIVANMQATAIQRRIQDQMAVESILQAACGIQNDFLSIYTADRPGNLMHHRKDINHSYDSEISSLFRGHKTFENINVGANKSFGDGNDREMSVMFEKACVPQRDRNDTVQK